MNLLDVELFLTMIVSGSLSRAAAKLSLSQPRATQMLQRLESQLGVALFQRSTEGSNPTPAAWAFRPFAEQMLKDRNRGVTAAQQAGNGVQGALKVGVSHTTSAFTVPLIMRQFHKEYPHVQLTLTKTLPPHLISGLESEQFDVCLCFKPPRTAPLTWEPLFSTDMVGIYAPEFEDRISTDLETFAKLPLVLPSRSCSSRVVLDAHLRRLGLKTNVVMEIDDSASLASMVRHGLAVSIIPRTMVKPSRHLFLTSLQNPKVFAEAGMLMRKHADAVTLMFAKFVCNQIQKRVEREEAHHKSPEGIQTCE